MIIMNFERWAPRAVRWLITMVANFLNLLREPALGVPLIMMRRGPGTQAGPGYLPVTVAGWLFMCMCGESRMWMLVYF